ncbi:MAG: FHA domain-containing protein [Polyangiaceae bacterium]|nr:FHA domain-containing protein [Polyangiaceae bacterium]
MICDVCGRENAEDLTFCQDCGRRLKARGQRVVPPTPPSGLPLVAIPPGPPTAPLPSTAAAPAIAPPPPAEPAREATHTAAPQLDEIDRPAARDAGAADRPPQGSGSVPPARASGRLRPEAPSFSFAPPTIARPPDAPSPALVATPAPPVATPAPPHTGETGSPAPAAPAVELAARPRPQPAAARVSERVESPLPATVAVRIVCASCDAENPPGYRFCVTCGAPLAKAVARTPEPPAPPPPAPPPPAPPPPAGPPLAAPPPAPRVPAHSPPTMRVESPGEDEIRLSAPAKGGTPWIPVVPPPEPIPAPRQAAPAGGAADKIVGAPVLDIAHPARVAPVRLIECARCHGHCIAGTRFCKYCGAPLDAERAAPTEGTDADRGAAAVAKAAPAPAGDMRVSPRASPREKHAEVATLPSSIDTASSASRSNPVPHVPLRSPYSVRSASPPPDARAVRAPDGRLVVIVEDGSEGKSFPLTDRQIDVGRVEGDILLEDDLYVSPRHARLIPQEGGWLLRDLGSVNRIYLRIRKAHPLRDADLLLLGLEVLQFQTVSDGERGLGQAIQHGTLLFGSPAIHRRARLCQKTVEGVTRDVYHLYRDETVIGRETGDIVFTSDPFLSRRHAVIRRSPATGEYTVTDLDSSNGTYVAIREDVSLVNGDFVRIGQHLFRVDLS